MNRFLAAGLYSPREAGRILEVGTATVKRWAFGYRRHGKRYEAAINTELPEMDDVSALTFLELIELLLIKGFLAAGASWPMVHTAFTTASKLIDEPHPFASKRWFADPGGIYLDLAEASEEQDLIEMSRYGQMASDEVLGIYLRQIEFDVEDVARRWYPLGKDGPIVLDPSVEFGSPVVAGTRIETEVLWQYAEGGEEIGAIADAYELQQDKVEAAITFERSKRAA